MFSVSPRDPRGCQLTIACYAGRIYTGMGYKESMLGAAFTIGAERDSRLDRLHGRLLEVFKDRRGVAVLRDRLSYKLCILAWGRLAVIDWDPDRRLYRCDRLGMTCQPLDDLMRHGVDADRLDEADWEAYAMADRDATYLGRHDPEPWVYGMLGRADA